MIQTDIQHTHIQEKTTTKREISKRKEQKQRKK